MKLLDGQALLDALRATGQLLSQQGLGHGFRLVVTGGTAGLLGGLLSTSRTTGDCDVVGWIGREEDWRRVLAAAAEVAEQMRLPKTWLNDDCRIFGWCLPLGWMDRCVEVGRFGPLEVWRVARIDLIAAKVFSSPRRPQDLEDVRVMGPTAAELDHAERNIDRLEAEDLDGRAFEGARAVVWSLRDKA